MEEIFAVTLAYAVGSVPFAHLLSRRRGVDLRLVGSGNIGAANAMRVLGVRMALCAVCFDGCKGAAAVLMAQGLTAGPATPVAAGLASVIGHVFPVWLGFRGGKGVATAAGVFAVLAPFAFAAAGGVFVLTVWVTRFVSVGSLAATVTLVLASVVSGAPAAVSVGAALTAVLVVDRHRTNLGRLLAGTERRLGQPL